MIISIANQKGGIGKTTSTICLGGLLADVGSCLAVDLDPQGNLTTGLGIEVENQQPTTYDVLTGKRPIDDAVVSTSVDIDLLPADISLASAEPELMGAIGREHLLKKRLQPILGNYQYVVIDCPPSFGLLTTNALTAADRVLVPVQCQFFALKGLSALLEIIHVICEQTNPNLSILGILPTMLERTVISQDSLTQIHTKLEGLRIFDAVPKSTKIAESNLAAMPIHRYANEAKLVNPYRQIVESIQEVTVNA